LRGFKHNALLSLGKILFMIDPQPAFVQTVHLRKLGATVLISVGAKTGAVTARERAPKATASTKSYSGEKKINLVLAYLK